MNLGVVFEHFDGHGFGALGKTNIAQLCKWIANGVKEVTIGHIATICQQH
jgi:hypothetical protein